MSLSEGHRRPSSSALPEHTRSRYDGILLEMASDIRIAKIPEMVHLLSGVDVCMRCTAVVYVVICY